MTHYTATTESGHTMILHGSRALATYRRDIAKGEAEPLIQIMAASLDRAKHRYLRDLGQCYGPCPLKDRP